MAMHRLRRKGRPSEPQQSPQACSTRPGLHGHEFLGAGAVVLSFGSKQPVDTRQLVRDDDEVASLLMSARFGIAEMAMARTKVMMLDAEPPLCESREST